MRTKRYDREVVRRLELLAAVKRSGSRSKVARRHGVGVVTLWRWQRLFDAQGVDGLKPRQHRCGRKSYASFLSPLEMSYLRIQCRRGASIQKAMRMLQKQSRCTAATDLLIESWLVRGSFPGSVVRAITESEHGI